MLETQIPVEIPLRQLMPASFGTDNPHVTARRIDESDANWLYELSQDEKVREYLPWAPDINSVKDAENKIDQWRQMDRLVRYVAEYDGVSAGFVAAWTDKDEPGKCETGSVLDPAYRGQGIVPTLHKAMEPFLRQAGIEGIISYAHEGNTSSQVMIAKRGLIEVGRNKNRIRYEKVI